VRRSKPVGKRIACGGCGTTAVQVAPELTGFGVAPSKDGGHPRIAMAVNDGEYRDGLFIGGVRNQVVANSMKPQRSARQIGTSMSDVW
jgi:hypothetical protein